MEHIKSIIKGLANGTDKPTESAPALPVIRCAGPYQGDCESRATGIIFVRDMPSGKLIAGMPSCAPHFAEVSEWLQRACDLSEGDAPEALLIRRELAHSLSYARVAFVAMQEAVR